MIQVDPELQINRLQKDASYKIYKFGDFYISGMCRSCVKSSFPCCLKTCVPFIFSWRSGEPLRVLTCGEDGRAFVSADRECWPKKHQIRLLVEMVCFCNVILLALAG